MPDSEIINHSPEQLARLCGCSPRHSTGSSKAFWRIRAARQTELRLLKARQLLVDTEAKVVRCAGQRLSQSESVQSLFKRRLDDTVRMRRKALQETEPPP